MLVFYSRIKEMLCTKVTDSSYLCEWTSEHPHSTQAAELYGMVQCYRQMLRSNFSYLVTLSETPLVKAEVAVR